MRFITSKSLDSYMNALKSWNITSEHNKYMEENNMTKTIDLINVAIKVQRQDKHECIISIGRLNDVEKDSLLNMYPLANHSLQCKNRAHYTPLFQMTISVHLPDIPDFKICDSDACCLKITDCMLTKIGRPNHTGTLCLANWFGSGDSESSNNEINSTEENKMRKLAIKKVIYKNPATIVYWNNGDKTVVKCGENESFDPEKGLAMAIIKHLLGNEGNYYNEFKKFLPNEGVGTEPVTVDYTTDMRK